jgi:hypothetical protein
MSRDPTLNRGRSQVFSTSQRQHSPKASRSYFIPFTPMGHKALEDDSLPRSRTPLGAVTPMPLERSRRTSHLTNTSRRPFNKTSTQKGRTQAFPAAASSRLIKDTGKPRRTNRRTPTRKSPNTLARLLIRGGETTPRLRSLTPLESPTLPE